MRGLMDMRRRLGAVKSRLSAVLAASAPQIEKTGALMAGVKRLSAVKLHEARPLASYAPGADSPILLVNNALAWGGVERQVVNTLLGLERRLTRKAGLLCLKLGEGGDYAFYRPALARFNGFVRDMAPLAEAEATLARLVGLDAVKRASSVIGWMPRDVQDNILRLTADFLTLKPAVVHAWQDALSIEAAYAARLAGTPKILTSARNMAPTHFAYFRPHMREAYRQIAACADVNMTANSAAGAADYATWLGLPASRFKVIRNGLDVAQMRRAAPEDGHALRERLELPANAPVVGSIFRFYAEKQPQLWMETAARVAKRIPDAHFVVFGVGPLADEARAFAEAQGFGARYRNPGTTDAALALSIFDCFLLTSRFEGTPNVVIEASSLGTPVVATAAGGTAEAIEEGKTGFVVATDDADALADRVAFVLRDAAWRGACAALGPAFCRSRFGLDRMLRETIALYGLSAEDQGTSVDVLD